MPAISIGLPVYNGEKYLKQSLDSILKQDFPDFELIISDNASTDATEEICRAYAARDSRIQYSRLSENFGAAKNYNRVFEMSSGTYFKWAAHDDLLHPRFLGSCVEAFETFDQPPSIVHPNDEFIDEFGTVIGPHRDNMQTNSEYPALRAFQVLQEMNMVAAVFGLFHRETLAKTRLIGSFIASDYVLLLETALLGKVVRLEGPPLFQRREHSEMSRKANISEEEVLRWFDPQAVSKVSGRKKLYQEYIKSVFRIEGLNPIQRVACFFAVVLGILVKRTRVLVGKWCRKISSK